MAKFEKGKAPGRPKGAKNLKTRKKAERADIAAQVTAAVLASAPVVPAKKAARKTAKHEANDAAHDPKGALAELQRLRWLEADALIEEARRLAPAIDLMRAARAAIAEEVAPPTTNPVDPHAGKWEKERDGRLAVADEAIKQANDRMIDCRRGAKALQDEAGEWANKRVGYDYAKLQPQSGNTDKTVVVNILKF